MQIGQAGRRSYTFFIVFILSNGNSRDSDSSVFDEPREALPLYLADSDNSLNSIHLSSYSLIDSISAAN